MLAFGTGRDGSRLGRNETNVLRDLSANGVDHVLIEDVELGVRLSFDHTSETRDPHFEVGRGGARHRLQQPGFPQELDLGRVELLATKILRVELVPVDENGLDACAAEHCGRRRSGKPSPYNGDICLPHKRLSWNSRASL